jgi:hypothetical protein
MQKQKLRSESRVHDRGCFRAAHDVLQQQESNAGFPCLRSSLKCTADVVERRRTTR